MLKIKMIIKIGIFALCLFCLNKNTEAAIATYESEIYRKQEALLYKMIEDKKIIEVFFQGIQEAFTDIMMNNEIPFDAEEERQFFRYINIVNQTLDPQTLSSKEEFAKELSFCQYSLEIVAPNIYEALLFKEIPNLGQLHNIFAVVAEIGFPEAWKLIKKKTTEDHCAAYDELLKMVTGTPAEGYIKDSYRSTLCKMNRETMARWHQVFSEVNPDHRRYVITQTYSNDFPVSQFAAVAKAYRPHTYDQYFERHANSFPVLLSLYNAIKSTAFTNEEKKVIRELVDIMTEKFPLSSDHEGRELETAIKVGEIVKRDPGFLNAFSRIPLIDNDGTFLDLILWISQKSTLEAKYSDIV